MTTSLRQEAMRSCEISARRLAGTPSSAVLARDMTTTAQAPSEICDDEPAVTVPSAENAGRGLAHVSAVAWGRTPRPP